MASNDPEPEEEPLPPSGPVAFLTRIVRLPASNDHTPLRIACVLILAGVLAFSPLPWSAIGFITLSVLALSLGRVIPKV